MARDRLWRLKIRFVRWLLPRLERRLAEQRASAKRTEIALRQGKELLLRDGLDLWGREK